MKRVFDKKIMQVAIVTFLVVAACIVFYFFIKNLSPIISFIGKIIKILNPLIIGLVLAYIMNPIVKLFENKVFRSVKKDKVRRNLSILVTVIIIIAVLIALISIIIPQLLLSIENLVVNIPTYLKDLESALLKWLNNNDKLKDIVMEYYDDISDSVVKSLNNLVFPAADSFFNVVGNSIVGAVTSIFNFFIGCVFAIYILANTNDFGAQLRKVLYSLFNVGKVNGFIEEVKHINHVFSNFMIGKICDSFGFVFVMTFLFVIIFKYPYPLLIAVIIGITDLVPYFGPYIGTIPSFLLILLVDPFKALMFIVFIIVLQQIDGNLVTPKIQHEATGLPSFWVLFSITFFGGLFGLVGILLAVPCFTIIYELIVDFINKKLKNKNMPIETNYYSKINGIEKRKVKANTKSELLKEE